jgi:hypothetical protein
LVETTTKLDGDHEKYIDLVHLTQEGRDQLTVYAAVGRNPPLVTPSPPNVAD